MNNIKQTEEMMAALDYTTKTVAHSYDQIYEIAKNMNQEQLLQLIGNILDASKQRERTLVGHIFQANNPELAINYAHTTRAYVDNIQNATTAIVQNNNQLNNSDNENSLPGNILM